MPCYDAAETLADSLDSIARQTLADFEVVLVDDGSQDTTPKILRDWAQKNPRFRLINQPHGGIISALNTGLEHCHASYVARHDADDLAHPERLARQVDYLDNNPDVVLVSCLVAGFPPGEVREGFRIYLDWLNGLVTHEDIRREIFIESPFPHPSVTFRKAWIRKLGGYQENGWPEDYDLWLRMYLAGARFAKVPETLVEWREHPTRLTHTDGRYALENFIRAKAYYLARGPLAGRDALIIWGAGMMGRRMSKHLLRQNAPLVAFVDVDPRKIGKTRRGRPIISPAELLTWWEQYQNPILLSAVGARGARKLIRARLKQLGLVEGEDWWGVA